MRHMSREGPGAHEAHLGGSSRGLVLDNPGSVVSNARIASVVTWVYGAGFGLATIPVAAFLLRRGRLPVFLGLFESYGGPWSARVSHATFAVLLMTFLAVNLVAALAARRREGRLNRARLAVALVSRTPVRRTSGSASSLIQVLPAPSLSREECPEPSFCR